MAMTADQLPDDPDALKAMVLARDVENARLIQIIKELQRHRFGRRAETLPEDQLLLGLEEAEQIEAAGEEEAERASQDQRQAKATKRQANRGSLPAHLPRLEMVVDIEDHACPCCRNDLHRIGEDRSERLDVVPPMFRVIVTRRPKYVGVDGPRTASKSARVSRWISNIGDRPWTRLSVSVLTRQRMFFSCMG